MSMTDAHGNNLIKCDIQNADDILEVLREMERSIKEDWNGEDSAEMRVLTAMYDAFYEATK